MTLLKILKRISKPDLYELLEDYTNWLCKHCYTDADVYAEEPKAVDRYLEEKDGINRHKK